MHAVDTNIIVRLVTNDDQTQTAKAETLFAANDIYVQVTVLLETEWVLRRGYDYGMREVGAAIRAIASLPQVTVENVEQVLNAVALAEAGMDFADALHVSIMPEGATFATFDRDLRRRAVANGLSVTEP